MGNGLRLSLRLCLAAVSFGCVGTSEEAFACGWPYMALSDGTYPFIIVAASISALDILSLGSTLRGSLATRIFNVVGLVVVASFSAIFVFALSTSHNPTDPLYIAGLTSLAPMLKALRPAGTLDRTVGIAGIALLAGYLVVTLYCFGSIFLPQELRDPYGMLR